MENNIKTRTENTGLDNTRFPNMLGDSHRYKTDKGEISMVHPCMATSDTYEIYCCEGDLFENIERYSTLGEAETRVSELLN